jgi:hypothetical protein
MSDENLINQPITRADEVAPRGEPRVMSDAYAEPKEKERTYEGDDSSAAQKAADDLTRAREERGAREQPEVARQYLDVQSGERMPLEETVSLERAADDLTRQRGFERQQAEDADKAVFQFGIDAVREGLDPAQLAQQIAQQQEQQSQQQPDQAAQPEITPQPATELPGIDPEIVQAINSSPKLRATLEQEAARVRALEQGAAQAQQHAATVVASAAQAALNATVGMYPELNGVPRDQVQNVLRAVQQNNPTRYNEIVSHLARVDQIAQANHKLQEHQMQAAQQQVQSWARQQDAEVDAYLAKNENPEVVRSVKNNLPRVLESFGVSVDDFSRAIAQTPLLRSASFQKMLFSLAKQHTLSQQVAEKADRSPPPPPMGPGTSEPRGSYSEGVLAEAKARMLKNPDDPKLAAAWLTLKRNAK